MKATTAQSYAWGAAWLRSVASDEDLPMPPEVLVVVIHALTEGLVFQRLMTPELVPGEAKQRPRSTPQPSPRSARKG